MSKSVFISYVFEDKRAKDAIINWQNQGLEEIVFTSEDEDDLRPMGSEAIKNHLRQKIRGAAVLLVLVGNNTHDRPWINYEIDVAQSLGKRILWVRIHDTTGAPPQEIRNKVQEISFSMNALKRAVLGK